MLMEWQKKKNNYWGIPAWWRERWKHWKRDEGRIEAEWRNEWGGGVCNRGKKRWWRVIRWWKEWLINGGKERWKRRWSSIKEELTEDKTQVGEGVDGVKRKHDEKSDVEQRAEKWRMGLKVHLSEEMITERRKANGWWWRCFVIKCFLLPNLSFQCSQLLHTPFVFSLFLSPPPALFFLLYLSFELMFFPLSFSPFGSSFSCFSLIYIPFIFCFVPLFPLSVPFLSHA